MSKISKFNILRHICILEIWLTKPHILKISTKKKNGRKEIIYLTATGSNRNQNGFRWILSATRFHPIPASPSYSPGEEVSFRLQKKQPKNTPWEGRAGAELFRIFYFVKKRKDSGKLLFFARNIDTDIKFAVTSLSIY